MIEVLQQPSATAVQPSRRGSTLFVSSSLETWATNQPNGIARDFQINDTMYRRLDPEYYAWLRSRMFVAKKAATAGHLPPVAFEDLRVRFNAVHECAVHHFGEAPLLNAVRVFCAGAYRPPVGEHAPAPSARKAAADCISPGQWPWSIRSASVPYRFAGNGKGSMLLAAAVFSTQSAASSAF